MRTRILLIIALMTIQALVAACGSTPTPPPVPPTPTTAPALAQPTALPPPPTPTTVLPTVVPTPVPKAPVTLSAYLYQTPRLPGAGMISAHGPDFIIETLIFNGLIKLNDKFEVVSDLAEKWEIAKDGSSITFSLFKNAKWHDGKPVTANDVAATFKLYLTKASNSLYAVSRLKAIKGAQAYFDGQASDIEGIKVIDANTIKLDFATSNVSFLPQLEYIYIMPAQIISTIDPAAFDKSAFAQNPTVGSGAFKWVKYVTDQYVEFVRNDDYFRGKPAIERIFLKPMQSDTAVAQLEQGELDLVQLSALDAPRLSSNPTLNVVGMPSSGIFQLPVSYEKPYLKDKRIRQAMMYALDRAGILKAALNGQGQVVNSCIFGPPWAVNPDLNPYKYDPAKAKQLVKDAGWDTNRKLQLKYIPGIRDRDATGPFIQQQFKEVGIQLELVPMDSGAFTTAANNSDFDIIWHGGGTYSIDPDICSQYYGTSTFSPGGSNLTHYSNVRADELFKLGRAVADQTERQKIYWEASKILNDEVPTIWMYAPNVIWSWNKRVQGVAPVGEISAIFWNVETWQIK